MEYAGAFYHVMARGNRRQPIFYADEDRQFWLAALAEACGRTGWLVHAWVLLDNHYHLAPVGVLLACLAPFLVKWRLPLNSR